MANIGKETWVNVTKGLVEVTRYDSRGVARGEVVKGGAKFTLSPEERQLNQDVAASPDQDLFKNGVLHPIRLLEDAEDYAETASNPNFVSDDEMKELFKLPIAKLRDRLASINSSATITRIQELAADDDTLTVAKSKVIEERFAEFNPQIRVRSALEGSGVTP